MKRLGYGILWLGISFGYDFMAGFLEGWAEARRVPWYAERVHYRYKDEK